MNNVMGNSTNWTKTRIGAVCRVGDGAHGSLKRHDDGIIYLTSKNFKADGLDLSKVDYIDEKTYKKYFKANSSALTKPLAGDVLFSIIGSIGEPYLVKHQDLFGISSSVAILRPDTSILLPEYLFYWIKGTTCQDALYGIKGGVAQGYVSLEMIRSLPLHYPPLPVQRKIAAVLSTYDDLIEVNTRRIHLLEEMAQAIYREWFVEFGFTGHHGTEMTSSPLGDIPKGWTVKEMQEIADVIDCLHSKKPSRQESGNGVLLQLFNIADGGKLDVSEKFFISDNDYKLWTKRIEVQGGDCVISNVGRIAAVAQVPKGTKAALGRNMTGVRPRLIPPTYLIEYLLSSHMENEVHRKKDAGAIMDSLNVRGIIKLNVPIPPDHLLEEFEEIVRPMRRRIEILMEQNFNLRRTRDLLLPRLVSGEVEVCVVKE